MNEDEVKRIASQIAKDLIEKNAHEAQFRVGPIPYHEHNGVDSPFINGSDIIGTTTTVIQDTSVGPIPIPNSSDGEFYELTGVTGNITFGVPVGSPVNGQGFIIRLTSSNSATGRTIAWSTATGGYVAGSVLPSLLPDSIATGKSAMVELIYTTNPAPAKWRASWGATGM